jgi:hypothetical protein
MERALEQVEAKWSEVIADISEVSLTPTKKNIVLELFGIAWLPYYLVQTRDQTEQQLSAFG